MSPKNSRVERPLRRDEFAIVFGTRSAEKGWRDLLATQRNAVVEAWEFLTTTPTSVTARNYPLKGDLAKVIRQGRSFDRWQHKGRSGARFWFHVDDGRVILERVSPAHPNETK